MNDIDRAFDRLREANPEPTRVVEDKPTARQMLATVQRPRTPLQRPEPDRSRPRRRALAVAAAAFAAVVFATVPVLMFVDRSGDEVPAGEGPSTTALSTTVPQTTVPVSSIDPETEGLVDTFVSTYNSGDLEAFMALLHPDFRRETWLDEDLITHPSDTLSTLYEVDAALHTEITLVCVPGAADAVCMPTRFDDLHRVLEIPPSEVTTWFLTFEDGLLRTWTERRPNVGLIPYDAEAVTPFANWVVANRPEMLGGSRWEFVFFSGGSDTWIPRQGIAAEVAELVSEWADSLGVTLEE
ncbi:MAG: hypothetical protein ABFR53_04160 [Actinomycetota bacterium]